VVYNLRTANTENGKSWKMPNDWTTAYINTTRSSIENRCRTSIPHLDSNSHSLKTACKNMDWFNWKWTGNYVQQ